MLTTIILELSTKKRLKSKIFENSHDPKIMKDHFTLDTFTCTTDAANCNNLCRPWVWTEDAISTQ